MKTPGVTLLILFTLYRTGFAQKEQDTSSFRIDGYAEIYYVYDFNKPQNNTRPGFIYSFNRHNEVTLNLGFIRASYNTNDVRAKLALMSGTYANANLGAEPGVLKNIFEAHAGVKITSRKNLWVDAGIFGSHIGFESAIGKDCWTLTRSILADNTPYYEAGAKISYTTDNNKWFFSALVLNGWQRIHRVEGNSLPSFGTQITLKPNNAVTLNSSAFIGSDKPDSARQMRYFHNLYGIFRVTEKVGITLGFDYGIEQKSAQTSAANAWYSAVLIARFAFNSKVAMGARGEFFTDENRVIIRVAKMNGTAGEFNATGFSANIDFQLRPNAVWRFEVRSLASQNEIFIKNGESVKSNTALSTSLAVGF